MTFGNILAAIGIIIIGAIISIVGIMLIIPPLRKLLLNKAKYLEFLTVKKWLPYAVAIFGFALISASLSNIGASNAGFPDGPTYEDAKKNNITNYGDYKIFAEKRKAEQLAIAEKQKAEKLANAEKEKSIKLIMESNLQSLKEGKYENVISTLAIQYDKPSQIIMCGKIYYILYEQKENFIEVEHNNLSPATFKHELNWKEKNYIDTIEVWSEKLHYYVRSSSPAQYSFSRKDYIYNDITMETKHSINRTDGKMTLFYIYNDPKKSEKENRDNTPLGTTTDCKVMNDANKTYLFEQMSKAALTKQTNEYIRTENEYLEKRGKQKF